MARRALSGTSGWDEYAPFYDWENARTLGRRDVEFWRGIVLREKGRTLELGCGTGRLLMPLARTGERVVGVDRSAAMLARARFRAMKLVRTQRPAILHGDIRALPFRPGVFSTVIAPYGMVQSLIADADLDQALLEAARVLRRGGLLGVDLVPDLTRWPSSARQLSLRGRAAPGVTIELREAVRQDRRRGLTIFDEEFVERRGRKVSRHRFTLTFRTRPLHETIARIERAGFGVEAVLGDYHGGPWDDRADVWVVIARKGRPAAKPPRRRSDPSC